MVITSNISAMNTMRNGNIIEGKRKKSIEKLSSGYRINRASDDAAGLSISEKLRSQVRGLDRASANAQDGISLIQTAEGALAEVHEILQRMNELSVQAANDTNTSIDREALSCEMGQLAAEIDRISDTTEFNTKKLLCGLWQENGLASGPTSGSAEIIQGYNTVPAYVTVSVPPMGSTVTVENIDYIIGGKDRTVYREETDPETNEKYWVFDHYEMSQSTIMNRFGEEIKENTAQNEQNSDYEVEVRWSTDGLSDGLEVTYEVSFHAPLEFELQVGAQGLQGITVSLDRISASSLDVDDMSIDSFEHAGKSIEKVQKALGKVSTQRSKLGAAQNRLEYTVKNLDNTAENTASAESRIRDVDMAREMMEQVKQSVLLEAVNMRLAQNARSPESVINLLRGV